MKRLITAICLCVLFATCPALGVVEFKDGLTHNIDYDFTDSIWVDYQTPNMYTTVNVLSGAEGGDYSLMAFGNSRINISSTTSSPGAIVHWIYSFDSSQVNISDWASISKLHTFGSSHVSISNGEISGDLEIGFDSIVDISGGRIGGSLDSKNASQVNISGGEIAATLYPFDNSTIKIYGSDFAVNGVSVGYGELTGLTAWSRLTGTLLSGESINTSIINIRDDARIILVPEPATLSLLALGWLVLRKHRV